MTQENDWNTGLGNPSPFQYTVTAGIKTRENYFYITEKYPDFHISIHKTAQRIAFGWWLVWLIQQETIMTANVTWLFFLFWVAHFVRELTVLTLHTVLGGEKPLQKWSIVFECSHCSYLGISSTPALLLIALQLFILHVKRISSLLVAARKEMCWTLLLIVKW